MLDTLQTVILLVLVILTILLVIIGVQVFFILRDFRKTVTKANKVLDNANTITENVSAPINALTSLTGSLKSGSIMTVLKLVRGFVAKDDDEDSPKKPHD